MGRLSDAAENVSRNIRTRHDLPELARRADEVGQLAAAFRKMTNSLYQRIEASERFAQDVAHELKNPLTAARSTAEALAYAKTPETRQALVREIQEELKRLNKLINDVSNAARMDAQLAIEGKSSRSMSALSCAVSLTCSRTCWRTTPNESCWTSPRCRTIPSPSSCRRTRSGSAASSPIFWTMRSRSRRRTAQSR